MNARKAHNTGRNHVANVRDYFASLGHDKAQSIIDQIVSQHESGGRAVMMAAPSMRLGAGFMNPVMPPTSESTRSGSAGCAEVDRRVGLDVVDLDLFATSVAWGGRYFDALRWTLLAPAALEKRSFQKSRILAS